MTSGPSLRALLLLQLVFMLGFAAVVPYIAAIGQHRYGLDAAAVGLVVGIRVISQQGLFFLGGALTDLFGPRRLMITGCLLRALGFATIAWAPDTTAFVFGVIVVGAAGALFSPAVDALVALVDADRRRTGTLGRGPAPFAALALIGEAGGAFAALLVMPFMPQATGWVSGLAAAAFLAAGFFVHVLVPVCGTKADQVTGVKRGMSPSPNQSVRDEPAVQDLSDRSAARGDGGTLSTLPHPASGIFTLIVVGSTFLALNAQLFSLVPLVFAERQIAAGRTGLVTACLSISVLTLQWPLSRLAERIGRHRAILLGLTSGTLGCIAASAGLLWLPATALTPLFCLVAVFVACTLMLGTPSAQSLIATGGDQTEKVVVGSGGGTRSRTWTSARLALLPTVGGVFALALTWAAGIVTQTSGAMAAWLLTTAVTAVMLTIAVVFLKPMEKPRLSRTTRNLPTQQVRTIRK